MTDYEVIERTQKVISTNSQPNYSVIIKGGKPLGIHVGSEANGSLYYFEPCENQQEVSNELMENVLKALLRSNIAGFDILSVCYLKLKKHKEYEAMAVKVFKEFWNELYNMAFADTVFGRHVTFDNLDKTYDFFEKDN